MSEVPFTVGGTGTHCQGDVTPRSELVSSIVSARVLGHDSVTALPVPMTLSRKDCIALTAADYGLPDHGIARPPSIDPQFEMAQSHDPDDGLAGRRRRRE